MNHQVDDPSLRLQTLLQSRRRIAIWTIGTTMMLGVALIVWSGSGYAYSGLSTDRPPPAEVTPSSAGDTSDFKVLQRDRARLRTALARVTPKGHYIVIDRTLNKLYLRDKKSQLLVALCSAGSGATLKEPGTDREWVFATPSGRFEVVARIRNPIWKKPDWAYIEEGQPIPTRAGDRFVSGELGEYALYFGNGYMIHGTLYERLLGRSVSHGCVRLGRDDLRALYAAAPLGTPIYVY